MKFKFTLSIILSLVLFTPDNCVLAQNNLRYTDIITTNDLESHLSFLASPLLKGRGNGDPGLELAQNYILSQVKLLGLQPANGNGYLQPYTLVRNTIDPEITEVQIITENDDTVRISKPVYQLLPTGPSEFSFEGEVIFAGYGLKQDKYGYNDFENIKPEGKILLVMNSAPSSDDGKQFLFEGVDWNSFMSIQAKLTYLMFSRAKAVLIVMDPKSGARSLEESKPGITGELSSTKYLKGENPVILQMPGMPKILFVHSSVADALLEGTGHSLVELQNKIDTGLKPQSFEITGKKIFFTEGIKTEEIILNNVAAIVEGSDPVLKNEYIVFSAHYDHIGELAGKVNPGADDNASGSAALLSIAEAFRNMEKKPLRSLLFLWVSGEEIGLFGSKSYVNNPLVPIKSTVVDINLDMIGRIEGVADTAADNPMTGSDEVFIITGNQSSDLITIAEETDKGTTLDFDYSLSGRQHPLQLFSRSDHYNFVKNDIPVLFFSSGLHTDYHTPGDVIEKIDFKKMELITETVFRIGYTIADRKERLAVDNPFSSW